MKSNAFLLFITCVFTHSVNAQCNLEETITVCNNILEIDDGNGGIITDGIINLYDFYEWQSGGSTVATGRWEDPNASFALVDETSGNLDIWALRNASVNDDDYQFLLYNTTCGNDVALTLNVVIPAYSGTASTDSSGDISLVPTCDVGIDPCGSSTEFDLFQTLTPEFGQPNAHKNGVWSYNGSSPSFIEIDGSTLRVDVQPPNDTEVFDLIYTIEGQPACNPGPTSTTVKVIVYRDAYAGAANSVNICESEIISGSIDVIDLRDDAYLVNEDAQGRWRFEDDTTGQITNGLDSEISLSQIYDDLRLITPRFGCETYEFSYFKESPVNVCSEDTSTISITLVEGLRPFLQDNTVTSTFCTNDDTLTTIDLYTLLAFTEENGVLFDYPNNACTNWELVSGPSTLGLQSNTDDLCTPSAEYTSLGTIDLSNITSVDAGTYVFRYTVLSEYNCNSLEQETIFDSPDGCTSISNANHPCTITETADVTITIISSNYAGEDTSGVELCEASGSTINLSSLLTTNGTDTIYQGADAIWTDIDTGAVINNLFTLSEITDSQIFNFQYTVPPSGCFAADTAILSFTVYEAYSSGVGTSFSICREASPFELFNVLTGNPDTNGTWSGPDNVVTTSNTLTFNPATFASGNYTYTVPNNSNVATCSGNQTTVSITITEAPFAGNNTETTVCRSNTQVDLLNFLDGATSIDGSFTDSDTTNALSGSIVDISILNDGNYAFEYNVMGNSECNASSATITINVLTIAPITVEDQTFCVIDTATVSDLEITASPFDFNWYDSNTATNPLPLDTLLVNNQQYFLEVLSVDGCASERTALTVTLLPIANAACLSSTDGNEPCLNDGISRNGDGKNDVFNLCDLPIVYPNFELEIFNRYGNVVYKGGRDTPFFDGHSNTSLGGNGELPSGIYFYVFHPNDGVIDAFQGSVFLSH